MKEAGLGSGEGLSLPAENCLRISHLSKTYTKYARRLFGKAAAPVKALDDVSFSLKPGFYGLLGPNGAGKSTLINIIVGSLRQDSGLVTWNGTPTKSMGIDFRRLLGYMPQQQTLYDNYTGKRFLSYIAALKEVPASDVERAVLKAAETVNLLEELDKKLAAYSGGMKQRLLAAAAIMNSPRLLIMDEPTAGLDPKERVHLRRVLSEIAQTRIVLVATHVVSDIESVSDEILILKKGRLYDKGPPQRLIDTYAAGRNLEAVYLSVFGSGDSI